MVVLLGFSAGAEELEIQSFQRIGGVTFNEISRAAAYHVEVNIGDGWFPLIGLQATGNDSLTGSADFFVHPWMLLRVSATHNTPTPPGFSLIPAGTFMMGSPEDEQWLVQWSYGDELHRQVTHTHDFFLQQIEVTNRQMADVLNWALGQGLVSDFPSVRNLEGEAHELLDFLGCQILWDGSRLVADAGKEDYPCIFVTWYGAQAYCNYLSDIEGLTRTVEFSDWSSVPGASGYRLPTTPEWEYACRAGTTTAFYTGSITHIEYDPVDPNLDQAGWYRGNSANPDNPLWEVDGEWKGTHPGGLKQPNAWGLYDMHGNVQEWCWDAAEVRGGSWNRYARYCRSAARYSKDRSASHSSLGFRPARNAAP